MMHDTSTLLWGSPLAAMPSSWHGHVPFAHWIVSVLKPRSLVELGTHSGVSYFAFCQAVKRLGIHCECRAVDTWEGDPQAGFYSNKEFEAVQTFNNDHFRSFSKLLRMYFDDALRHVPDGSVDLLHIDGLHTYEAVKHDFDTWLPKMSNRGVILFHDTEVQKEGFGVWQFFSELRQQYPAFQFRHSAGLGVLVVGTDIPNEVWDLVKLKEGPETETVRQVFERLSNLAKIKGEDTPFSSAGRPVPTQFGRNVALSCPTSQSSAFDTLVKEGNAVSGKPTGGCGFHTRVEESPWWSVDLGKETSIAKIVVYNRIQGNLRERARSLSVLGSLDGEKWTAIYDHDGAVFGGIDGYPLVISAGLAKARYVKLYLRNPDFFHLDEVEIYAAS